MENKSLTTRVIIFVVVMVAIIAMMTIVVRGSKSSGKYDTFTSSLKDKGAKFYGAFWCPHCQAQEKALDSSRQRLESIGLYVECSTPDAQSQTQICIDNKIESYPTWTFPNGIHITSADQPIVCDVSPGKPDEDQECAKVQSQFFKRWIFSNGSIVASATEPKHTGDLWSFDFPAQLRGEIPLPMLAEQTGATLPADDTSTTSVTAGATSTATK